MGFFSWNCKKCGKSIRSPYSIDENTEWMCEAVALLENGSILMGEYDGYGRINDMSVSEMRPTMYHHKCWIADGKPEYSGESAHAEDQGFFIDEDE